MSGRTIFDFLKHVALVQKSQQTRADQESCGLTHSRKGPTTGSCEESLLPVALPPVAQAYRLQYDCCPYESILKHKWPWVPAMKYRVIERQLMFTTIGGHESVSYCAAPTWPHNDGGQKRECWMWSSAWKIVIIVVVVIIICDSRRNTAWSRHCLFILVIVMTI